MKTVLVVIIFIELFVETSTTNYITTINFNNRCGGSASEYGVILQSHGQSGSYDFYNQSLSCPFTFNAKSPYDRVLLEFKHFDISVRYGDPTDCSSAYMSVHDGASTASPYLLQEVCGSSRPSLTAIESTGSSMTIYVYLDGNHTVMDFKTVITSFTEQNALGNCPDPINDFKCETKDRCISMEMTCLSPNISSCGDNDYSDQSKNAPLSCDAPVDLLPLWIALALLGALLPFVLYWCCWRPGYFEWLCGCWRHKKCCDPCKWCARGSRNLCRACCAGHRGCGCCGPRNVADEPRNSNGYSKAGTGSSSKKGVFVSNYTHYDDVYGESPPPYASNNSKGGYHTRESR